MYNKILAYSFLAVSIAHFAYAEETIPQEVTASSEITQNQHIVLNLLIFTGTPQETAILCTDCKYEVSKNICSDTCKVVSYGKEHTDMEQIYQALQSSMAAQVIASPNFILTHNQESILALTNEQNETITFKCIPTFNEDHTIALAIEIHFNDSVLKTHTIVENQEVVSAIHEHENNLLCILMQTQTV